ncbi:MAG: CopG family transcriptional regulator [Candidatus Krumholzibacteriia bacterium]
MPNPKVTLKIPKPLYEHISRLIEGSGFNSVTDFVVFVLRDIVYEGRVPEMEAGKASARRKSAAGKAVEASGEFSGEQLERIKQKLKELGYL